MTAQESLVHNALRRATREDVFAHAKAVVSHPERVAIAHILDFAGECKRRGLVMTEDALLDAAATQRFAVLRNYLPMEDREEYPE